VKLFCFSHAQSHLKLLTKLFVILYGVIFLLASSVNSEPFSRTDKFSLSYPYLNQVHRSFLSDTLIPFFSLPEESDQLSTHFFAGIKAGSNTIQLNGHVAGSFEAYNRNSIGFGLLGGEFSYQSRIIEGLVDFDIYSADYLFKTGKEIAGYERFIVTTKGEYVSGFSKICFNLPQAFLKLKFDSFEISSGRKKMRWGPGIKGTLGLSGVAYSPFYLYHMKLDLADKLILSAFCAGMDDDSYFDQIDQSSLDARYFSGQRIDWKINDHVQIGLYDFCDFSGQKDFIRYFNPLQIYVFGQFNGPESANLIGGIDVNVLFKPFRFYGELVDDDITIFDNSGNPNKFGYQVGAALYRAGVVSQIGVEYNHIAKYVFGNSYSNLNQHAYWGSSLGWPWGNDQDLFTAYALLNPHPKINVKVEANYWIKGSGDLSDSWIQDGSPSMDHVPYWPNQPDHIVTLLLNMQYRPWRWLTTDVTLIPELLKMKPGLSAYAYILVDIPGNKEVQLR
jgi:hypothetical protein